MAPKPKTNTTQVVDKLIDQLEKIKDEPRRRRPKSIGIRSSVGVFELARYLFGVSELRHMTNAALEAIFRQEFPANKRLIASFTPGNKKNKCSINWMRHAHNRGKLIQSKGFNSKPYQISLRYDNDGDPVDSRTGERKLDEQDIRELCLHYEIPDERWFTAEEIKRFDKLINEYHKEQRPQATVTIKKKRKPKKGRKVS